MGKGLNTPTDRPPVHPSRPAPSRNLSVDFIRGCALLGILWNHVAGLSPGSAFHLRALNPSYWVLFDWADVFVFLSGLVFGLVHIRAVRGGGLWASYAGALTRAWELYAANILTFVAVLVAFGALYEPGLVDGYPHQSARMDAFAADPTAAALDVVTLQPLLDFFDILILYLGLLCIAPALLWGVEKNAGYGLAASGGLWVFAQAGLEWGPPAFNLFAWQFLFCLGMVAGVWNRPLPRRPLLFWSSLALAALGALAMPLVILQGRGFGPDVDWAGWVGMLTGKSSLRAGRVLSFAAAAYLVARLVSRAGEVWNSSFLRPIVIAGQNSLGVFCFGIVITYVAVFVVHRVSANPASVLAVIIMACLTSVAFAYAMEWRKRLSVIYRSSRAEQTVSLLNGEETSTRSSEHTASPRPTRATPNH